MLVLQRKLGDSIIINDEITITVVSTDVDEVELEIEGPDDMTMTTVE